MSERLTAVVDRIVDGEHAVLLLEADGEVIDERTVPAGELPADATEGCVLWVTVDDGQVIELEHRPAETDRRRESVEERLDRLSRRLSEE